MGHMELCNGAVYDGQFQKGLPNGVGIMKFPDGSKYEGEFMQVKKIGVYFLVSSDMN